MPALSRPYRLRSEPGSHHLRFYVHATYAASAGTTVGAQLSLWEWDGRTAHPLLVVPYAYMIDQAVGLRVEGDFVRLREKGRFKSFFVTEPELGRQMEQTIRIGPEGVEDLGAKPLAPDLDLADDFIDRTLRGVDASVDATPLAAKALGAVLADQRKSATTAADQSDGLGELMSWGERRAGRVRTVCIVADDASLLFTLAAGPDGVKISHVAHFNRDRCESSGRG